MREPTRVSIKRIISQQRFGVIMTARVEDAGHARSGQTVQVKALSKVMAGTPRVGEVWLVTGTVFESTVYGVQVEASSALPAVPTGKLVRDFVASQVLGVGQDRAQRLWNKYGFDLGEVLLDDTKLLDVAETLAPDRPNLGPALAAACMREWRDQRSTAEVATWLASVGFDDLKVARRVLAALGVQAAEALRANPYVLVPLMSWDKVDGLGLKVLRSTGVVDATRDPRRLVGAVDAVVRLAIIEGDTALTEQALRENLAAPLDLVKHSKTVDQAIQLGELNGAIVSERGLWRAPGCAAMEDYVVSRLRRSLQPDYPSPVQMPSAGTLGQVAATVKVNGFPMHAEQVAAVVARLQQPVGVLQGGAGTGKTTTMQAVCDLWESFGGDLVLACVTGKASLRLSRSTRRIAMTLARLLGQLAEREEIESRALDLDASQDGNRRTSDRLELLAQITPKSLVVVDEASMLDLPGAYALARRMPEGARLLLVGDEAQLPPVGFGLIYHRLATDPTITSRLTVVHRQTEASGIPAVAGAIRGGEMPTMLAYTGKAEGVSFLECTESNLVESVRSVWISLGGLNANSLIVTATRPGEAGVTKLNQRLQEEHAQASGLVTIKGHMGHRYCPGDPVVWLKNDYSRGLVNGLMGRVRRVEPEERSLLVQFDGCEEPHDISVEQLIDLNLAYAITCHKAQGSQAPAIIVPLYRSIVLDTSWLYTAVTRAEHQVVLVGSREVLREALARPWASTRRIVGFRWEPNEAEHPPPQF